LTHTSLVHSGGSAKLAVDPGARATFTFTGQSAKWIAFRDQWAGIAKVYVDGEFKKEIDTYASPEVAPTVMFTVTGLAPGAHTLSIEVAGRRNPASMANWIWIDAFDASAAIEDTGRQGETGSGGSGSGNATGDFTRVEQTESAVAHIGDWGT